MKTDSSIRLIPAVGISLLFTLAAMGQSGRPDDRKPAPSPSPATSHRKSVKRIPRKEITPKPDPVASLIVNVNPADSIVFVNGVQAVPTQSAGVLRVDNLRTSVPQTVLARRTGYQDRSATVNLLPGAPSSINLNLLPLPGSLNVTTGVNDAEIVVRRADTGNEITTQSGAITNLELVTGPYSIEVTKEGLKPYQRDVFIIPGQSVYLEPRLERLEPRRKSIPMTAAVRYVDKHIFVTIQGFSSDGRDLSGSISVVSSRNGAELAGWLPGVPCGVQLIRGENISEISMVEVPGSTNQWSRAMVRIKPKDQKRLVTFALNWQIVHESHSAAVNNDTQESMVEAVAVVKARPTFPTAARNMRASGDVSVHVEIDEYGKVTAAKAIAGPAIFYGASEDAARRWKFTPARRGGRAVSSSQTILFTFQMDSR